MVVNEESTWIMRLDEMGPFNDLGELRELFDSIPEEDKNHPKKFWFEGLIMGRSIGEELSSDLFDAELTFQRA